MTLPPRRLVVIGHPIDHSLSPAMMNAALRSADIDATYGPIDVPPAQLARTIRWMRQEGVAGNVTVPLKEAFLAECDRVTATASSVGAVNTFWCEDGSIIGHNTDVHGFDSALRRCLRDHGIGRLPRRVVLLGAGGGAAAVVDAMRRWDESPASIGVLARTPERVRSLRARFPGLPIHVVQEIDRHAGYDLLVNATPVGLDGSSLPVDVDAIPEEAVVFDLVYHRTATPLVRAARLAGRVAIDGLTMLVEQGAAAFEAWFGVAADRGAMWTAVTGEVPGPG